MSSQTFEWEEQVFADAFDVSVKATGSGARKHVVFVLAEHAGMIYSRLRSKRLLFQLLLVHE